MPHITLPNLPGIRGPMTFRPETSKPLDEIFEVLLRHPNSLTPGERELIAAYVTSQNKCHYCQSIHGAIAAAHLDGNEVLVQCVKHDFHSAEISPKLKTLLTIAGKVQQDGKKVTEADVEAARHQGATDLEIHDTVLIAAAFCMYNRYVEGLATIQPKDLDLYRLPPYQFCYLGRSDVDEVGGDVSVAGDHLAALASRADSALSRKGASSLAKSSLDILVAEPICLRVEARLRFR